MMLTKLRRALVILSSSFAVVGTAVGTSITQDVANSKKENSFISGNLCNVTSTNIDCSNGIYSTNLESSIGRLDDESQANNVMLTITPKTNVVVKSINFKSSDSTDSSFFASILREASPMTIQKLDSQGNEETAFLSSEEANFLSLTGENQENNFYELKASETITIKLEYLKTLTDIFLTLNLKDANTSELEFSIKIAPFINKSSKERFNSLDSSKIISKEIVFPAQTTTELTTQLFAKDANTTSLNAFYGDYLLEREVDRNNYSRSVFAQAYWEQLLDYGNDLNIALNKEVEDFSLSNVDFSKSPKDFLSLSNIKKLKINNATNLFSSNISYEEWKDFFSRNVNLGSIEFSNLNLTDNDFSTEGVGIRGLIEAIPTSSLEVNLSNNSLTRVPTLANLANITNLNLMSNRVIDLNSFSTNGWSKLENLNLSRNFDLVKRNTTFLSSINNLTSIMKLDLSSLSIGESPQLQDSLSLTNDSLDQLRSKLVELKLDDNGIASIDNWFSSNKYPLLTNLTLSGNNIKFLPNSFTISPNDLLLDFSDNRELEINTTNYVSGHALLNARELNLQGTGKKTFANNFKESTNLKIVYLGDSQEEQTYNYLLSLPNTTESISLNKVILERFNVSEVNSAFKKLPLKSLNITNSNASDDVFDLFNGVTTLENLDLSQNNISGKGIEELLNLPSIQEIIIEDNFSSSFNLNNFLLSLTNTSSQSLFIYLKNTPLGFSTPNQTKNLSIDKEIKIVVTSPQYWYLNGEDPISENFSQSFFSDSIKFYTYSLGSEVKRDPRITLLESYKNKVNQEISKTIQEKTASLSEESRLSVFNRLTNNVASYSLPKYTMSEATTPSGYSSYLTRAFNSGENLKRSFSRSVSLAESVDDLISEQNKIEFQLEELKNSKSETIATLNKLSEGRLSDIAIALISVILALNILFLGILFWRRRKNRG